MTIAFQKAKGHGRIGGVRLTVRRGARSAPSRFPAGRPRGTRQIMVRAAPISEVLGTAAAADPEVVGLWPQDVDPRFIVLAVAANALVAKPGARPGVSAEHAADVLYGILSPELYLVYVRDRGWTPQQWEHWTYDVLYTQLCAD